MCQVRTPDTTLLPGGGRDRFADARDDTRGGDRFADARDDTRGVTVQYVSGEDT